MSIPSARPAALFADVRATKRSGCGVGRPCGAEPTEDDSKFITELLLKYQLGASEDSIAATVVKSALANVTADAVVREKHLLKASGCSVTSRDAALSLAQHALFHAAEEKGATLPAGFYTAAADYVARRARAMRPR